MEVTTTLKAADRDTWRTWLTKNHKTAGHIWLVLDDRDSVPTVLYLDAVEEALCFGWIDGLQKRISPHERAQRFTPRRRGGNWTELNKARARRLIQLGLMTDAGRAVLPDLDAPFVIPTDIAAALKAEQNAWQQFVAFPELYQRIRVRYVEDARKDSEAFDSRLQKLVNKTALGQMFGQWNDGGRLG